MHAQSVVGEHFRSRSQVVAAGSNKKPSRHIPPMINAILHYRSKAMDLTQRLHSLTWDVAVRRANCFSQALGIAVTSYMASLSDGGPILNRGFGEIWAKHGYLIVFEGLLSAIGKELGMIEGKKCSSKILNFPYRPKRNNRFVAFLLLIIFLLFIRCINCHIDATAVQCCLIASQH